MLLGTAIYDATIAAWDTKYAYKRPRPFIADKRIKAYTLKPESPSYPCEHSVAAGVAVAIIAHFFPTLADSVNRNWQSRQWHHGLRQVLLFPVIHVQDLNLGKRLQKKKSSIQKIM